MLKYVALGAVGAVVAMMVYVRLAPLQAEAWHSITLPVGAAGEVSGPGSHTVVRDVVNGAEVLARLDEIIMASVRTRRVAGSVEAGKITYVTRSRIMGFPDYTTVQITPKDTGGASLAVFGRLRFGSADLGVNKARVEGWMAQLDGASS